MHSVQCHTGHHPDDRAGRLLLATIKDPLAVVHAGGSVAFHSYDHPAVECLGAFASCHEPFKVLLKHAAPMGELITKGVKA